MPVKKHLKEASRIAHPDPVARLNAKRFAFSAVVEGLNLQSIERYALE